MSDWKPEPEQDPEKKEEHQDPGQSHLTEAEKNSIVEKVIQLHLGKGK